jgi:hypothetical protein
MNTSAYLAQPDPGIEPEAVDPLESPEVEGMRPQDPPLPIRPLKSSTPTMWMREQYATSSAMRQPYTCSSPTSTVEQVNNAILGYLT